MNKYPSWKYYLVIVVAIWGILYSLPVFYGDDPAVQITGDSGYQIDNKMTQTVEKTLQQAGLKYKSMTTEDKTLLVRFSSTDTQLKAQELIKAAIGDHYTVALNLAPSAPEWLSYLGAKPMKLGLDLRGGVHFLLAVDVNSLVERRIAGDARNIRDELRNARIRQTLLKTTKDNQIIVDFRTQEDLTKAAKLINSHYSELDIATTGSATYQLTISMSPEALVQAQNYAVDQTMMIIQNRINELGVAEPIVQRQGADRIAVDLPGIQDTARAKQILGGTATIELHLVDVNNQVGQVSADNVPAGTKLYHDSAGRSYLVENPVILSGASITGAVATIGENGQPEIQIRLGGGGESLFYRTTGANVGKPLAIIFIETKIQNKLVDGKVVQTTRKEERVISAPTIESALGNNFRITGVMDIQEARNLALLLRAGALPAPISFIAESTVGPSLGKENIQKGVFSIEIGLGLIVLFMLIYYRVFGLIANVALLFNLIILVALLSLIEATLTLPGLAAILLTLGMAVDANVLIFERIREELRNGMSPHASIYAGYERAFSAIIDSNLTTLIAAIALFVLGTGAIKGFAVTLTLGLITSMFTSITGTRAIVECTYGRMRHVKKLSIGI